MNRMVFWDAWAFIALASPAYSYHAEALAIEEMLVEQGRILVTTEAVLTEVGNALSKHWLRPSALRQLNLVNGMVELGTAFVVETTHQLWQRGWALYQGRLDKDWGHTDCISFVVMDDLGIAEAFTADRHFEQAGFIRLVKT